MFFSYFILKMQYSKAKREAGQVLILTVKGRLILAGEEILTWTEAKAFPQRPSPFLWLRV